MTYDALPPMLAGAKAIQMAASPANKMKFGMIAGSRVVLFMEFSMLIVATKM